MRTYAIFKILVPGLNEWYYRAILNDGDDSAFETLKDWLSSPDFMGVYTNPDGDSGEYVNVRGTSIMVQVFVEFISVND